MDQVNGTFIYIIALKDGLYMVERKDSGYQYQ